MTDALSPEPPKLLCDGAHKWLHRKGYQECKTCGLREDTRVPLLERAALSPREFALVFGRDATWSYRLIYAGKLKFTDATGRTMIPISEVKRLQATAKFQE